MTVILLKVAFVAAIVVAAFAGVCVYVALTDFDPLNPRKRGITRD